MPSGDGISKIIKAVVRWAPRASEHRRRASAEVRGPCEIAQRFRGVQVRGPCEIAQRFRGVQVRGPCEIAQRFRGVQVRNERPMSARAKRQ
jgi:hypothetical protein